MIAKPALRRIPDFRKTPIASDKNPTDPTTDKPPYGNPSSRSPPSRVHSSQPIAANTCKRAIKPQTLVVPILVQDVRGADSVISATKRGDSYGFGIIYQINSAAIELLPHVRQQAHVPGPLDGERNGVLTGRTAAG